MIHADVAEMLEALEARVGAVLGRIAEGERARLNMSEERARLVAILAAAESIVKELHLEVQTALALRGHGSN